MPITINKYIYIYKYFKRQFSFRVMYSVYLKKIIITNLNKIENTN